MTKPKDIEFNAYLEKYGTKVSQKHYQKLEQLIKEAGLEKHAKEILELAAPCVRIKTFSCSEQDLKVGMSYFGGLPDLPEDMTWPERAPGEPLSFLGQVNFKDIEQFDSAKDLPKDGLLQFYYHSSQDAWGDKPKDKSNWKVIHVAKKDMPQKKRKLPVDNKKIDVTPGTGDYEIFELYQPTKLFFYEALSLPSCQSEKIKSLQLKDKEINSLYEAFFSYDDNLMRHQFFGEPRPLQSLNEILFTKQTCLFFQIDSDDNPGWLWGDCGILYFLMQKQDLEKRDFDKVWMILQSC